MNRGSNATVLGCIGLVVVMMLGVCVLPFAIGAVTTSPYEWVQGHYPRVTGDDPDDEPVIFASDKPVTEVVGAITGGTDPDETQKGSATSLAQTSVTGAPPDEIYYLRYDDDWLVVVYPNQSQTLIEVQEFDDGYQRHSDHIGGWSDYSDDFRGGGGGFGK